MRKRKMYLSVEDIAELFGLSVSFAYRVVEKMNMFRIWQARTIM